MTASTPSSPPGVGRRSTPSGTTTSGPTPTRSPSRTDPNPSMFGCARSPVASARARLAAIDRAEQRLDAGTYGRSIRSGQLIPDERLEADPAAELTVDEANDA